MALVFTEDELKQAPEEVFTLLEKLGEGSYGSVHRALHNRTSAILAVKIVPVNDDLEEIIQEISVMKGCISPYIVRYYGSWLRETVLWVTSLLVLFRRRRCQKVWY